MLASELRLERALRLGLVVLEFPQPALERSLDGVHLACAFAHCELELVFLVAQACHLVAIRHAPMIGTHPACLHPDNAATRLAFHRKNRP